MSDIQDVQLNSTPKFEVNTDLNKYEISCLVSQLKLFQCILLCKLFVNHSIRNEYDRVVIFRSMKYLISIDNVFS